MRGNFGLMILLTVLSGSVLADDTSSTGPRVSFAFSFRGHQIGDLLEKHELSYRNPIRNHDPCRSDPEVAGRTVCNDGSLIPLPEVQHEWISFEYLDGKLVGFSVGIDGKDYRKFREVLEVRYGSPDTLRENTNKGPLSLVDDEMLTWNFLQGDMTFYQFNPLPPGLGTSLLKFESPTAVAEIGKRRKESFRARVRQGL